MISGETVETACSQVGELTDEQMAGEFDRFFRAQPGICEFIVELTQESGQNVQELALFLSYMVFKTIETSQPNPVKNVTHEDIETAYRETETWMNRVGEAEGTELHDAIVQSLQKDTEPYLLQYVISELNEPMHSGVELTDEEKGEVFFVIKTVISSLCGRRIIEVD